MTTTAQQTSAIEINVTGTVQGVGFRPFVYKLATSLGLKGWVVNTTAGVSVHLEGSARFIDSFVRQLKNNPPVLSSIDTLAMRAVNPERFSSFFIHESRSAESTNISIPPDTGTCSECLAEFSDIGDRRYGYEFTNCINCGPRFSITSTAPYDRANTSMEAFEMCDQCSAEYADPSNRRFHAEPNACPVCGPRIKIVRPDGSPYMESPVDLPVEELAHPVSSSAMAIRTLLKEGFVLAIKGIGGYHLSCDATNAGTVKALRERKRRQGKPFALMCRDLTIVREHCELTVEEESLLTSPARPILLLKKRETSSLHEDIAPGLDTLGTMLPYTSLHTGLFDNDLSVLVMTSANISGDPLIIAEADAFHELGGLADFFVTHDRIIVNRADDSVLASYDGKPYFVRRSRGYVPKSVSLPFKSRPVFAAGGDLKSVFAYAHDDRAVPSQYFGDLDNLKNIEAYEQGVRFYRDFLQIKPEVIVCDLHPGYASGMFSKIYAEELGVPLIKVQHHKAHFASAMVDAGIEGDALGIVADGTGYGEDGTIWGFEFFHGGFEKVTRAGSLASFPQPRGDTVAKNPLHMATVLLYHLWGDEDRVLQVLPAAIEMMPFVKAQLAGLKRFGAASGDENSFSNGLSIASSSCGRLFDAASALCGFTSLSTYEGEAAMRMESMANIYRAEINSLKAMPAPFGYRIEDDGILRLQWDFLGEMAAMKMNGADLGEMAYRFHQTIACAVCDILERMANRFKINKVVISGGTFQNRLLLLEIVERLLMRDMVPYVHRQVPANDGGLALGQVALASGSINDILEG